MQYLYQDFRFGRHTVRYVRLPGFPTNTTVVRLSGSAFHRAGEAPSMFPALTTHNRYQLLHLREQQHAEKRLLYFDIADAQLANSGQVLEDFEEWVGTDDAIEWALTSSHLSY